MRPILQLALDVSSLDHALRVAEAVAPRVDWFEAGTSLVVSEGLRAVRALRQRYPSRSLVADVKVIDGAEGLVPLLLEAGADVVTVVGSAFDHTIATAVELAHSHGGRIIAEHYSLDLTRAPFARLAGLGVDYVGLHLPYEPQEQREAALRGILDRLPTLPLPAMLAGGIDLSLLRRLRGTSLTGLIVGGAILHAKDPTRAAQDMSEVLQGWRRGSPDQ